MNPTSTGDTIVQEVTIKAPAERIFKALTNPQERVRWWGAEGRFQVTYMESDLRPGGKWMMRGIGIGGKPFIVSGGYSEIDRPRLLAFTWLPDWQAHATRDIVRGDLRLLLSGPTSSAGRPMPDGRRPEPGGWNRIHFIVDDLTSEVARLRTAGVRFRNDVVKGPGGSQILLDDPSGNPIELFQPARLERT